MLNKSFSRLLCYRNIVSPRWIFTSCKLSVHDEIEVQKPVKKQEPKKYKLSINPEVRNYLVEKNFGKDILNLLPKKLIKKGFTQHSSLCLVDENAAERIVSLIYDDLRENTSFVVECSPGLGILTNKLLQYGIPKIHLFEKNENFYLSESPLMTLTQKYKEQIDLRKLDFFSVWVLLYRDLMYKEGSSEEYFRDAPTLEWKDKTANQIIACIPNKYFLSALLFNFIHQTRLFEYGRPAFYLAVPSFIWERITADNNDVKKIRFYTQQNVVLHLAFDTTYFGELPRKSFLPWPKEKPTKKKNPIDELNCPMVLVKLEVKKNVYDILDKEDWKGFWFFLKHCMRSKKSRVVMEVEKLISGCGERLVEKDYDICTTFKELPPQKLLELFQTFKSWPEYDENLFIPSLIHNDDAKKNEDDKFEGEEEKENENSIQWGSK
ncbi:hypothetical protein TKK_0009679 [Trichogramma kaykai]|uniref:rRNA adenine N(6)-methyltransferase n=1 Tax=Trichogramma kaykai TaxID=54128 RepID=A0ABD2X1B8_9HYME